MANLTSKKNQFSRFNIHHRIQHIMMFTSFIVLALTGLPMKYHLTGWAAAITKMFGGFDNMFTVHLIAATVMLACSVYHLIYLILYPLFTKKVSLAAVPNFKDVTDLMHNMQYLLGLRKDPPRYDRYSYKEKFDYWAVFWGMAIMGGSGLMLWFPHIAAEYLPRWVIDSAQIAHSDEAMLAILAIFVWHFYNVHFSPSFFPGSLVWFHGKMSRELMEHEHPIELERLDAMEKYQEKMAFSKGKDIKS